MYPNPDKSRGFESTEAMSVGLSACAVIFLYHYPNLQPIRWWRGYPSWAIDDSYGKATITCKFWIGYIPRNEYDIEVRLVRLVEREHMVWRPISAKGTAINFKLDQGRFQNWTFTEQGEVDTTDPKIGWIPYFPPTTFKLT